MASEEIGELAKRRGFFFGSNGAYGAPPDSTPSVRRARR